LQGTAEIRFTHPDDFREWVRQHKRREMVEKLMTEREAISRYVADGDYIAYDFSSLTARNPDVFLVHVHQADAFGNARIFGTNLFALEAAMASRKVIVSAEEIVDPLEFRKDPLATTIPYFLVDAVVHLPFGAYPAGVQARYELDLEHIDKVSAIQAEDQMQAYLAEYDHPLWKDLSGDAQGAGHGGMDYIEDYRLIKCMREGLPTDMNVYDAAALSAVVHLSEQSVARKSGPVDFPDFTRGLWRTHPPLGILRA